MLEQNFIANKNGKDEFNVDWKINRQFFFQETKKSLGIHLMVIRMK